MFPRCFSMSQYCDRHWVPEDDFAFRQEDSGNAAIDEWCTKKYAHGEMQYDTDPYAVTSIILEET